MSASSPPSGALSLGAAFPTPDRAQWLALVEKVLKGGDFERRLVSHTHEGLRIEPLSEANPARGPDAAGLPGLPPFTRGARAMSAAKIGAWDIRQRHTHPDPVEANRAILADLERGVTSVMLSLDAGTAPSGTGIFTPHLDALDQALDDVYLEAAPVALDGPGVGIVGAALYLALLERRGLSGEALQGSLGVDALGAFARRGTLPIALDTVLARVGALSAQVHERCPNLRTLRVDTQPYHDAGAGEAQELGAMLATGVAYLRALVASGLEADAACGQLAFTLPVDADQFLSLAKLRAARRLWDHVTAACGATPAARAMTLHAQTSTRMMARRDPWVNVLRTTVAAFAAACAGAQAITVQPFTAALGHGDARARRIARNIQIVLMEESGLGRVMDPAGGAWAIEDLTDKLVEAGWARFQEIEADGGMGASLASGAFAARVAEVRARRDRALATRSDSLTGVSAFPDLQEGQVVIERPDLDALAARFGAEGTERRAAPAIQQAIASLSTALSPPETIRSLVDAATAGALTGDLATGLRSGSDRGPSGPAFKAQRLAAPFEALRDAADHFKGLHGHFPRVGLVTLGPLARHTARVGFTRTLLAAGGLDTVECGPSETADAAATAFRNTGLEVAVICASPDDNAAHGTDTVSALTAAGARMIVVAGKPGEITPEIGIDLHLYTGCDTLAALAVLHERLGVAHGG